MLYDSTGVKDAGVALIDPDWLLHLASTCSVFRYRFMMSSAFAMLFSKLGS
jgi:hypothetical protein